MALWIEKHLLFTMRCIMITTCVLHNILCDFLSNSLICLLLLVCGSCTGANRKMGVFPEQSVTVTAPSDCHQTLFASGWLQLCECPCFLYSRVAQKNVSQPDGAAVWMWIVYVVLPINSALAEMENMLSLRIIVGLADMSCSEHVKL